MAPVVFDKLVRKLPRHAHALPRSVVVDSQRWRILEATVEVASRVGFGEMSVADVVARAGVSRKAFYEHFDDKEDCFLTAYDLLSDRLIAAVVEAGRGHADERARLDAQVVRFLEGLARNPSAARVFMVDVLGAGRKALRRREQVNGRFARALFGKIGVDAIRRIAVVGGVNNVVAGALLRGRGTSLLGLARPLSDFVRAALEAKPPR